jgi:hypothetical protein
MSNDSHTDLIKTAVSIQIAKIRGIGLECVYLGAVSHSLSKRNRIKADIGTDVRNYIARTHFVHDAFPDVGPIRFWNSSVFRYQPNHLGAVDNPH